MSDRDLLMIPGPIELEPAVLAALGERQRGHLDPVFMKRFASVLGRLRTVLGAPGGQPVVVSGSGTLAMELAVANLVEPGDAAVVVNTGYFSDRLARMLERHGAAVTSVNAAPGEVPSVDEVAAALEARAVKVLTVTHVDTSTGVRAPVEALAALARSRGVLCVVDGVCSVGGEALDQEAWGVDVVFTASQKALGAPPGLAVAMFGSRALEAYRARTRPVAALSLDLAEWLPVLEAYEAGRPAYFATPAVNLISALDVSLSLILAEGMAARVARHRQMADAFRAAWSALGLTMVPAPEVAATTLSAVYYPQGHDAALVKAIAAQGVTVAGGLHPALKARSFRVGHMGAVGPTEVLAVVGAVERALGRTSGAGLAAAQAVLGRPAGG